MYTDQLLLLCFSLGTSRINKLGTLDFPLHPIRGHGVVVFAAQQAAIIKPKTNHWLKLASGHSLVGRRNHNPWFGCNQLSWFVYSTHTRGRVKQGAIRQYALAHCLFPINHIRKAGSLLCVANMFWQLREVDPDQK